MEGAELCFPHMVNSSCRKPASPLPNTLFVYSLLSIICVLTAALNLLVIISISHFRQLHTPTNFILLSLAVSDFCMGVLVMPVEILLTSTCWMLGDIMCSLYFLVPVTTICVSVGNMVLICIDRYIAICDPLHYPTKVTLRAVTVSVVLCWIGCVFYSFFLLYDNLIQPGKFKSCDGECVINIIGVVDLVIAFIIPIAVIVLLYLRVFMVALSQARAMKIQVILLRQAKAVKKTEIKAAKTLGILVAVFLICYCPYYCVSLAGVAISAGSTTEVFMIFVVYFNSCLNPIVYALFYPWYKKAIRLIVTLQILQSGSRMANLM